ncbi:hypothetical protein BHE74_00012254 [Ensete ventricosum]|nr:hypothetical protein GW17_00030185 [Ensete ventricosum]RWW79464.1 hypothetical protein BHE74_00012254 [Ensete ventricosum]
MGSGIGSSPTLRRRRMRDLTDDSSRRTTARCAVEGSSQAQNPTAVLGLGPIRSSKRGFGLVQCLSTSAHCVPIGTGQDKLIAMQPSLERIETDEPGRRGRGSPSAMAASFHLLSSNTFTIPLSLRRRRFDADRKLFHEFPKRDPFSLAILSPAGVPKPIQRETTTWRASLVDDAGNGAVEAPKPTRRGRKKKPTDSSPATPVKRTRRRSQKKTPEDEAAAEGPRLPEEAKAPTVAAPGEEEEEEDFDDGMDFPYESPPLVCCFGAARREFVPTVRVSERQMHPDQYSSWKQLQWSPPEFVRAPGGPPSDVAISHARLGGRAAFMGKVGDDDFGNDLVYRMNLEKVQTRAVKIDPAVRTAASHMKIELEDRDDGSGKKLVAKAVKHCAEDSFLKSEIDVAVLKEVCLNVFFLLQF